MKQSGSYIGGSSLKKLGSIGGPDRKTTKKAQIVAASPRSGGTKIKLENDSSFSLQSYSMLEITFKKFRRRAADAAEWTPFLALEHRHIKRALTLICIQVEELAQNPFDKETAKQAALLRTEFYKHFKRLKETDIEKARFDFREQKREKNSTPRPANVPRLT